MPSDAPLVRVTKRDPCPVCGRLKYCSVFPDGSHAICTKVSDGSVKRTKDGHWLHRLNGSPKRSPKGFGELARAYQHDLADRGQVLADRLGLSIGSLKRFGLGHDGRAYTAPMLDGHGAVVGIQVRPLNGRKLCRKGSKLGLFIPADLPDSGPLYVCEGMSDSAALLDMGLPRVIGRPSATAGADHVVAYVDRHNITEVVIVADGDEPGQRGARNLGAVLVAQDVAVRIITPPDGAKDVRAWAAAGATKADFEKLVADAEPFQPSAEDQPVDPHQDGPAVYELANHITKEEYFAVGPDGDLHHYSAGCYRPGGNQLVHRLVKARLAAIGQSSKWSSHKGDETCTYIATDAPRLWDRPPLDTLCLTNGLLDVDTRELRPHSPDYLSPVQLPLAYDPAATCPEHERLILPLYPEDAQELAWQIRAYLMLPDTSLQKALLLFGTGANGKSTELDTLTAFIGQANLACVSLHDLEANRFAPARLVGKLANVCSDLPSAHLAGSTMFKRIVGEDPIHAERKFRDGFDFQPFARLVFSANHLPRAGDASDAVYRRWVIVPFSATFEGASAIARKTLMDRLTAPRELSGVLNKALDALPGLRKRGFTESESLREAALEFRSMTDPVAVWLDEHTVAEPSATTTKADLHASYNRWAENTGKPRLSGKAFSQALRKLRSDLDEGQRTIHGRPKVWCWLGIGLVRRND